jgi:hypothetical protein
MGSVRMDLMVGQRELEGAMKVDGRGMRIFKPKRELSDTDKGGGGGAHRGDGVERDRQFPLYLVLQELRRAVRWARGWLHV